MPPTDRKAINSTLLTFYNNPVARVSMELFLTVGTVIFFGMFAIRPTLVTMSNLIRELEDKRELDQQLGQKIAALTSAQTQYAQIEPELYLLEQAIPNSPRFKESLKVIEKIASDNQLVISSITASEIPAETIATQDPATMERVSLPLKVQVTGPYAAIREFIEDVTTYRRQMIVDNVSFNVREERGYNVLTSTVTVNLQYFRNQVASDREPGGGADSIDPDLEGDL